MRQLTNMYKTLTQCKCGSTEFIIFESIMHKATLSEVGELGAYNGHDNQIDNIMCANCDTEYTPEQFNEIIF